MIAGFTKLTPEFTLRMIVSVFYTITGALKIFNIEGFNTLIKHYRMFSQLTSELLSYLLPPLEITLGILLFTKNYTLAILTVMTILQVTLTLFTIIALKKRGLIKNCGIFGNAIEIKLSWKIILTNTTLFSINSYLLTRVILGLNL